MSFAFATRPTLHDVTLTVAAGSFFALVGESGSGKTTLLRLVGGYLRPDHGSIHVAGRDLTDLPPERRGIGTVFQSYALFPHLSARGNVAFGLEVRGLPRHECDARVEEALDRVGLPLEARARRPGALSGGQQQRVALARALVIRPDLLLLDEPLANLDRRLREQVRGELRALQRQTGVTTLLVTHDPDEALALADTIAVLASGRVLQVGPPRDLYERPICPYVARLLGEVNLLRASDLTAGGIPLSTPGEARVLIRPEHISVGRPTDPRWTGPVRRLDYQGSHILAEVAVPTGLFLVRLPANLSLQLGDSVGLTISPDACHALPADDPPGVHP
ncbi:MAG: ABC transporter ATP-binding protein [Gemmataceae bacterium]